MVEGKLEESWNHTALIAALIRNANRGKGDPAATITTFHPMHALKQEQQKSRGIAARMNRDLKENLRSIKPK